LEVTTEITIFGQSKTKWKKKMMSKKSSETQHIPITTLRKAFAGCCKILGLDIDTCVTLILMLSSEEELATIIAWILREEDRGNKPSTTEVVQIAENIKDYYMEKQEKTSSEN
jgi:hypothetical protein